MDCKNKTVLVTGATSGIGRACLARLVEAGAHVVGVGRDIERLQAVQALHGANCTMIEHDLGDLDSLDQLVAKLPVLNGLVLSAGITKTNPVRYLNRTVFNETLAINLLSPVFLAADILNAKKLPPQSSIVFMSSIGGTTVGMKGGLAYAISKAGMEGAGKALAIELASKLIRVNTIAPGMIETELVRDFLETAPAAYVDTDKARYPLGKRYGKPSEVADLATFLISDSSSFITGQTMLIDGGRTIDN